MDSIENWPGGLPDTIQAVTCNHRGIAADLSGDLRAAASAFEQAVNLFESAPHSQARARRNLAMACATLEDYGRAIEEMVAVLDFWTERGDLVMEGKSFCTLSNIYMLNGNWEEATVAMLTGLALLEANPEGQSITIAIEKGNLAGHYFNTGDFEQAADMYLASAAQLWAADRREQAAQTEMNAINVLSFVGDTARISDQLQRLKFRLRQQPVSSARSLGWLASLEAISAPQDSSYVPKLAQVWDEHGAVMDGGRSHVFAWVNALALLGDTLQALAVLDRVERERPDLVGGFRPDLSSFATLKAQLSPSKLGDALLATQQEAHKRMNLKSGILRGQFAHQQLKSDNAQLEKLRQQERRTFYVLVGALVLLLFTIWVLMLLKGARRERDLVQAQTQHHLAGQALQKERRDHALQTLQFAELQKQIGAQVERLDEYNVSRELTSKLRDLSAFETSESQFYKRFEGVFPGFESRMRERFPEITAAEFGLACLILLGLSNGEIASVLHVTQSGVLSRTFRLRKRLGISKDVSLIEYLTTL
jgi:tetratricopeptide (TPR) repeat protein/DNA-binding CsgD family transcriptional regulator